MDRPQNKEQEEISLKLYQYMCENVVGSENVVKSRRLYFTVFDDVERRNDRFSTVISSGSRAEGLDLPGSDMDYMICDERYPVYDCKYVDSMYDRHYFIMKSENTKPGFVHLILPPHLNHTIPIHVNTVYGRLISNRKFKFMKRNTIDYLHRDLLSIHGPCLSNETNDYAFCFRCNTWPFIAQKWLLRNRIQQWPPSEEIHCISSHGVLLVPIGSKSIGEDNELEWRISFSEPEKMLIHSFNHTQLLCYALLKLVLKQVINKDEDVNNLLCSYYLKTTLFWISEEHEYIVWRPKKLLDAFWNCLERLRYWINHGYLPNYFIPEHNMIDGKIDDEGRRKLVLNIEGLQRTGCRFLAYCESLYEFMKIDVPKPITSCHSFQFEKTILGLILKQKIIGESKMPLKFYNLPLILCLKRINGKEKLSKHAKILYTFNFAWYSLLFGLQYNNIKYVDGLQNDRKPNNKQKYKICQKYLPYLVIGTNIDAISGWIILAIFFFSTKQYFKCADLLHYVSSVFLSDECCNIVQICCRKVRRINQMSFFKRLRTECVLPEIRIHTSQQRSSFFHTEYLRFIQNGTDIVGSPFVLAHGLNLMCSHALNNFAESVKSHQKLIRVIENGHLNDDQTLLAISYQTLKFLSALLGDKETASNCDHNVMSLVNKNEIPWVPADSLLKVI